MNSLQLKGVQLCCDLTEVATLIVSFGAGSLKFQIIIKNGKRPPMPRAWPTLEDTNPTYTGTAGSPTESRKLTFDFAGTSRSLPRPETREQSPKDDKQIFRVAVNKAAVADIGLPKMLAPDPTFTQ